MFFFSSRRRHTRYWRDWSSDVCSSDLAVNMHLVWTGVAKAVHDRGLDFLDFVLEEAAAGEVFGFGISEAGENGRGAWWGRVGISVGGGSFKKKKQNVTFGRLPITLSDT